MRSGISAPPVSPSDSRDKAPASGPYHVGQNIEAIWAFYAREEQKLSRSQRVLETIGGFMARPLYLGAIVFFVALWILANLLAGQFGLPAFDPPPFSLLQGIVTLGALLTATAVLIKQDRLGKLEERLARLDLQVNLLTEQEVTKLIKLMEELRRDLPMVKDRHDPEAAALQQPTDAHLVLAAMDERRETEK